MDLKHPFWGVDHACWRQDLRDSINMLISGTVHDFDILRFMRSSQLNTGRPKGPSQH